MRSRRWLQFWIEVVLGILAAALAVLTLFTREWIEAIFGVDSDHGSGLLEWLIVAVLALAACLFTLRARVTFGARALRPDRSVVGLRRSSATRET
jgi:hypothetical protein